jgi:hypothetical protein
MKQRSSNICIWTIYLSVDPIFQSLWFLSWILDRRLLLTRKSLNQGFLVVKLKSPLSLKSFTVASTTWLTTTEYLCHKWPRICSVSRNCNMILSSCITYYRVCNKSNTTVATYGTGNAYPPGKTEFTPGFLVWFVLLDL